ncbi:conserved hypothetical protein [Culex quinquefasciatus]|uniref:Peptidase S1 domain-containing protein n=1 Tax=Culex quinquefasciatus TaxID=7176 RepID=B0XHS1_CULQU|nr:conserved hypothetical protein [Culex quinquefasciatus]|eukprot:XP_001869193.1 conserved hypothetical protein [Culex quinquefasciatus]
MISRVQQLTLILTLPLLTSSLDQHQTQCGVRRNQHESMIVYGSDTRPGEWPWHAAILHRTGRFLDYACGGTLISEEFVVTAAHCLCDQDTGHQLTKRKVRVRLGVHNLDKTNADTRRKKSSQNREQAFMKIGTTNKVFKSHGTLFSPCTVREFAVGSLHFSDDYSRETNRGDIGLVELTEPVRFSNFILPACVNGYGPVHAELGTVIGWGATEHQAISPVLRKATLPVVDSVDCLESDRGFFGSVIHRDMFCAGFSNGTVVCNGDSGGGLFVERNGVWLLAGIISFTKGRDDGSGACVSQGFAGFTNVAQYSGWIQNVTGVTVPVLDEIVEPEVDQRDLRLTPQGICHKSVGHGKNLPPKEAALSGYCHQ